jgi:hypothetical protein
MFMKWQASVYLIILILIENRPCCMEEIKTPKIKPPKETCKNYKERAWF